MKDSDWNKIALKVKDMFNDAFFSTYSRYEHMRLIEKWTRIRKRDAVLSTDVYNLAFDEGEFENMLTEKSNHVIGMDISKEVVKHARKRNSKIKYVICDARNLPFKERSFDIIISPSTLDHFPRKELITSPIEIKRALLGRGSLILLLENKHNIFLYFWTIKKFRMLPYHTEPYSLRDAKRILSQLGFHTTDPTAIVHLFNPLILFKALKVLRKRWKSAYQFLEKEAFHWVFLAYRAQDT
jgi:SAM-dependent methyltransferase